RAANRAGSFDVTGEVSGGRVVLVDDVFTTGATLDAAARALTGVGAPTIRALSVARACSRTTPAEACA
ncbi:MAG: phosphoribosyltransferase family protein, partial [Coriobacteriia bacterium]|nr:phosphoribosyltransferase family protein [Coriobacteriia bacterium]